ncbi:ABC transporter permease [Verminephrobacter eiseniae]|uniref:ABC transporter permease n=1 Tax=Verminephrobacter eiseniae TaxID=364317 RepID=UPI0010CF9326|nr:ABC transporter permease [Verminephrobacter eiseniae]KAB7633731.1 ABC transporter permease [Verminephrobacter sp. Larva24]MCW5233347.1 ABC transporter permease [Verminephrobacter eiseniae]MCW5295099.1 ABC transporter permease [Verminephrobacter eiseniae]MCW8185047.1 ABC transporter permease [Verminephrobacter eiseniae]MCW8223749.1 ABC transporter permease [Verminephrobacter eiseniae]
MRIKFWLGSAIVGLTVLLGPVAAMFAPQDPRAWQTYPRNLGPSLDHFLGTTALGQDIFWLLSWSVRNSLLLGVTVGALATIIGVAAGLVAGYRGGLSDRVLSFLMDGLIVIPSLPLLILLSALSKGQASMAVLGGMLVLFNWPFPARQVRSVALSLRERDFVSLAWFSGESLLRIVRWQLFPYLRNWAVANFINTILVVIAVESSLAFLGLSNDAIPTLGTMIYWALKYQALFAGRWYWIVPPILAVILIFVGLFLFSNSLTDRLRKHPGAAL